MQLQGHIRRRHAGASTCVQGAQTGGVTEEERYDQSHHTRRVTRNRRARKHVGPNGTTRQHPPPRVVPRPIQHKHAKAPKRTGNALERHCPKGAPRAHRRLPRRRCGSWRGYSSNREGGVRQRLVTAAAVGGTRTTMVAGRQAVRTGNWGGGEQRAPRGLDSAWVQPCCAAANSRPCGACAGWLAAGLPSQLCRVIDNVNDCCNVSLYIYWDFLIVAS